MSLIMPEDRERMKTGNKLDKLEELLPREVRADRPGPQRSLPVQCCNTCKHINKLSGNRYECNPPGSWFIKEIKGGELSVLMPHMKPCWSPSVYHVNEHVQDPWNATREKIQDYLGTLERNLKPFDRAGLDDYTTEDNPI